jgi:hypothetical protein
MSDTLAMLVDDYLAKHDAANAANNRRHQALRECAPPAEKEAALQELIEAHNARAQAFRALRDARKKP